MEADWRLLEGDRQVALSLLWPKFRLELEASEQVELEADMKVIG